MKKFDIEIEFVKYMQRMGLDVTTVGLDELAPIKRAFVAGVCQLYEFSLETVKAVNLESVEAWNGLEDQLSAYKIILE